VTILDLSANGQLGEIDQGAVEPQDDGTRTCCARHRAVTGSGVKSCAASGPYRSTYRRIAARFGRKSANTSPQARLRGFSAVERTEAAANVVETVVELIKLPRGVSERVGVVADPP
jgi:hypothetical protein